MGFLVLRFDDATLGQFEYGFKIMNKYNLVGSIYPIVNRINKKNYINWDQLHIMYNNGWEIGSHTMNHKKDWIYNYDIIDYELVVSKKILEKKGFKIINLCYPFNQFNQPLLRKSLKYYKYCLGGYTNMIQRKILNPIPSISSKMGIECIKNNIRKLTCSDGFLVITFHTISDNTKFNKNIYNTSIDDFEKLIKYINDSLIKGLKVVTIEKLSTIWDL
jgi:peptidoglycan/xylan/chitin deacetylase (PgdA/CDA1 family)